MVDFHIECWTTSSRINHISRKTHSLIINSFTWRNLPRLYAAITTSLYSKFSCCNMAKPAVLGRDDIASAASGQLLVTNFRALTLTLNGLNNNLLLDSGGYYNICRRFVHTRDHHTSTKTRPRLSSYAESDI